MAEPAPEPAGSSAAHRNRPTTDENGRLKLSVIWSFTLSRVAFSIMGVMFGVYLMKYATDVLLIAPAAIGVKNSGRTRLWASRRPEQR